MVFWSLVRAAIVAGSRFRCAWTSSGGVEPSQWLKDTSTNLALLDSSARDAIGAGPMEDSARTPLDETRGRRLMFEVEDIRDWIGKDVGDNEGLKIGSLETIYFDTATQLPAFAAVKTGIVGRHRLVLVPLEGSTVSPNHLQVTPDKKAVKDAPTIEVDGELTAEQEPLLYAYYQIPYTRGATGERRLGRR